MLSLVTTVMEVLAVLLLVAGAAVQVGSVAGPGAGLAVGGLGLVAGSALLTWAGRARE
ncbi:MAG: hypothetical protein HOQ13_04560 [Dermatophilaceae bacterium]|nr:hypothetical protein [Dermatophilaceae bacterium]